MEKADVDLDSVQELYDRGLLLQAYGAARGVPLHQWPGVEGRLLAGRLAYWLGAPRLSRALVLRAWREDSGNPKVQPFYLRTLLERHGPWRAWDELQRCEAPDDVPVEYRADLFVLRAQLLAMFRDFEPAEEAIGQALRMDADHPWVHVGHSGVLEAEDRPEEALDAARRAIELRPWYPPAIVCIAHLLQLLDRDDEALAILTDSLEQAENGVVAALLAAIQVENEQYNAAADTLERFEQCSPLLEKTGRQWLASQRSDIAFQQGDRERAAQYSRQVEGYFHERITERLTDPERPTERVVRKVAFLRQNYKTCGPATLAMLGRYFQMPTDHLSVADEICYGGTREYSERRWAAENGFETRELTLTVEGAEALLDRDIPFAVGTVDPTGGHMQIIMGYDRLRGVFLVRDPYHWQVSEFLTEEFLKSYASSGPRALVVVPRERAEALEGLPLQDAALYDRYFELQEALQRHDHARAIEIHRTLAEQEPEHRLTIRSRLVLCSYEEDQVGVLSCVERLLGLYPDDHRLLSMKLSSLRELGWREDRLGLLEELSEKPERHPAFDLQLVQELGDDGRETRRCQRLLRRVLRRAPQEAASYVQLGRWLWNRGEFDRALQAWRIAAGLDETDEDRARQYFMVCRSRGRAEEALAFLRQRFERFARKSGAPGLSLCWALDELGRTPEGLQVLEESVAARPDDPELLVCAADVFARVGREERADALLAQAEGKGKETTRLRVAARIALYRGRSQQVLEHSQALLRREPLDAEAHQQVATEHERRGGRTAALEYLRGVAETYPFQLSLQQLHVQCLGPEHADEAVDALRRVLERDASDSWSRRQLASHLADLGRLEEALEEAETACRIEPSVPSGPGIRAHVLERMGRVTEATDSYREALEQSVDYTFAMEGLLRICASRTETEEALAFLDEQLTRQTSTGDGITGYWSVVTEVLEPDEVLERLEALRDARPDLWQTWSAVLGQLLRMRQAERAGPIAAEATQRFLLVPRLWADRSRVCRALGDADGERDSLEKALEISPGWSTALCELSEHFERAGDLERARAVLEDALVHEPLNAQNHGYLADLLVRQGHPQQALDHLETALRQDPTYFWAFQRMHELAREVGCEQRVRSFVRALTEERPGHASTWFMRAQAIRDADALDERVTALQRACQLQPAWFEVYDLRAELLTEAQRFAEAEAACREYPHEERLPTPLEGRLAWIQARRGDVAGAIERMRETLGVDPQYQWGWMQLAEWLDVAGRHEEYLEAAQSMVRVMPHVAMAHGYLGDARLKRGERADAKKSFRRAVDLEPEYEFAGFSLYDLLVDEGQWKEAEKLHAILDEHVGGVMVHMQGLVLDLKSDKRKRITERLRRICEEQASEHDVLALLMYMLGQAGKIPLARETLKRLAGDWGERADVASWKLLNVAVGLRLLGEDQAARSLSRGALQLAPDRSTPRHHLWMAADTLHDGDFAQARLHLDQAGVDDPSDHDRQLHELIEATLAWCLPTEDPPPLYETTVRRIRDAYQPLRKMKGNRPARRLHRRCLRHAARHRGGLAALLATIQRMLDPREWRG